MKKFITALLLSLVHILVQGQDSECETPFYIPTVGNTKALDCGTPHTEYNPDNNNYYRFLPDRKIRVRVHVMQDINGGNNFQDDLIILTNQLKTRVTQWNSKA